MKNVIFIICLCNFCLAYSPESRIFPNKNEAQYYAASSNFKWIPDKYAFRCGDVNSNFDIGFYSVSFGYNCLSDRNYTMTWGSNNEASEYYATAWGVLCKSKANASTSWGFSTKSSGAYATSWGYVTEANSFCATAWGRNTKIDAVCGTGWGYGCTGRGNYGTVAGYDVNGGIDSDYSLIFGRNIDFNEPDTFAVGFNSINFTVSKKTINIYDSNIVANGHSGVTADVNVITNGNAIATLHFVKGIYVGRDWKLKTSRKYGALKNDT